MPKRTWFKFYKGKQEEKKIKKFSPTYPTLFFCLTLPQVEGVLFFSLVEGCCFPESIYRSPFVARSDFRSTEFDPHRQTLLPLKHDQHPHHDRFKKNVLPLTAS